MPLLATLPDLVKLSLGRLELKQDYPPELSQLARIKQLRLYDTMDKWHGFPAEKPETLKTFCQQLEFVFPNVERIHIQSKKPSRLWYRLRARKVIPSVRPFSYLRE